MLESLTFSILHWSWLAFVIIGLTLFSSAYYFRRESNRLAKALAELYALNQEVKQDALAFFDQAWPILQSAGCLQMQAELAWFGEQKNVTFGSKKNSDTRRVSFCIARDDMQFDLLLFINRQAAEPQSLSSMIVTTYVNILEQNLVLKQAEILASQKRLERYQLFVQHEIKNIAQFIQLLNEQVQAVQSDQASEQSDDQSRDQAKVALVNRLEQTLPIMVQRATRTIQQMTCPISRGQDKKRLSLKPLISEVLEMYSLNADIVGSGRVSLSRPLLIEVFKNVLGNFRDHRSLNASIKILIEHPEPDLVDRQEMGEGRIDKSVLIKITGLKTAGADEMISERLFEPFWTTSESGMGLGLFLARELLKQLDGRIRFEQNEHTFSFLIQLPVTD